MIKHYVSFLLPGIIVCETITREVKLRDPEAARPYPKNSFAFMFYDREEETVNGELLAGKNKNYSGTYYIDGRILTVEEVKKLYPEDKILIDNTTFNNIDKVIVTRLGNFQPYNDNDTVVKENTKLKFRG